MLITVMMRRLKVINLTLEVRVCPNSSKILIVFRLAEVKPIEFTISHQTLASTVLHEIALLNIPLIAKVTRSIRKKMPN